MAGLSDGVRRLLLAVSLSADLRVAELRAIGPTEAVEDAVDAGVLVIDGDASASVAPAAGSRGEEALAAAGAARAASRAGRRGRRRGVACAARRACDCAAPTPELADTVAHAAASASARGARQEAVVLGEHALRLTPPESAERTERLLVLAGYLETAGEVQRADRRAHSRTRGATSRRAAGPRAGCSCRRAPARRTWTTSSATTNGRSRSLKTIRACGHTCSPRRRRIRQLPGVVRIRDAEAWASEALRAARRADPEVKRLALYALAWTRALSGRPIDELCRRARRGVGRARIHCGIRRADRGPAAHVAGRGAQGANGADEAAGVGRRAGRADVIRVGASAPVRARAAGRRLGRSVAPAGRVGRVC